VIIPDAKQLLIAFCKFGVNLTQGTLSCRSMHLVLDRDGNAVVQTFRASAIGGCQKELKQTVSKSKPQAYKINRFCLYHAFEYIFTAGPQLMERGSIIGNAVVLKTTARRSVFESSLNFNNDIKHKIFNPDVLSVAKTVPSALCGKDKKPRCQCEFRMDPRSFHRQ